MITITFLHSAYKLVFVVKKTKSEPLLSLAGLGAVYVSADEKVGMAEADAFFPPGHVPRFRKREFNFYFV